MDYYRNENAMEMCPVRGAPPYHVPTEREMDDKKNHRWNILHEACLHGNLEVVQNLRQRISRAEYINMLKQKDMQGMTPLHFAAVCGYGNIIESLPGNSNLSTKQNKWGETPLHMAATEGRIEIVQQLVSRAHAEGELSNLLKTPNMNGSTALHLSIYSNYEDIVFYLLDECKKCISSKHILNAVQNNKMTPLHLAAIIGNVNIVKELIKLRADINAKWKTGATPLITAAKYGHQNVVAYLLQCNADWKETTEKGYTAFLTAVKYNRTDVVQYMVTRLNAVIRQRDLMHRNIFHICAAKNNFDVLNRIAEGDNSLRSMINIPDIDRNTPLHIAAENGNLEVLEFLLEIKASKSLKNKEKQTPLHLAVINGHVKIVKALLDSDHRLVHDKDKDDNTSLHLAAIKERESCVRQLLIAGADFRTTNAYCQTPLDCCAYEGQIKGAEILLEAGAPLNWDQIKIGLGSLDPGTTYSGRYKMSPLHWACMAGHVELVKLFIGRKSSITQKNSMKENALDIAAEFSNEDCALEILRHPDWKKALRNARKSESDGNVNKKKYEDCYDTPMRKLIRNLPTVAERVFDKCIESKEYFVKKEEASKEVKKEEFFDFEFVDDFHVRKMWIGESVKQVYDQENDWSLHSDVDMSKRQLKEDHCLEVIIESKNIELLRHPLMRRLVTHKWEDARLRFLFWAIFLFYAVFMSTFNIFMATTPPPYAIDTNLTTYNGSCVRVVDEEQDRWGNDCSLRFSEWQKYVGYTSITFGAINLLKEFAQMARNGPLDHFADVTNWVEFILYTSSIATMVPWTQYTRNTGVLMEWQWKVGSFAIFLSWMELLFFVESIPKFRLGIYVLMFENIVKTFLKFFVVLSVFVCGCAFTFHALFQNQVAFMYFWNSIVKTILIMIGEVDYDSMFNSEHTSSEYSDQVHYDGISYVLFVISVMTLSIIVMNMLVGLAVDDIKQVQNKAELKSISQHAKLVLETEYLVPSWFKYWRRKTVKGKLLQTPDDKKNIDRYKKDRKHDGRGVEERVEKMKTLLLNLRTRLHDVNKRTQSIESMVVTNMKCNQYEYDKDNDDLDL